MRFEVRGWASTTGMDHVRHVVAAGAFDASIRRKGLNGPGGIRLLAFHDSRLPVGAITKLESRRDGLWLEGYIDDQISYGRDLALATKAAGGLNFSVGFFVEDADLDTAADGAEYLLIKRGELQEVSIVTFPCNPGAAMTEQKETGDKLEGIAASLARMKLILEERA